MLAWLLSSFRDDLEVLSCRTFGKLFYFPPLAALKHLLLDCHNFSGLAKALRSLPKLETLSIDGYDEDEEEDENGHLGALAHLPALDLSSNTMLLHVRLCSATVGSLTVAPGCEVSLKIHDDDALERFEWAQLAPVLYSFSWMAQEWLENTSAALQCLRQCTALSVLQ
jgi:hypothetical protein